MAATVIDSKLFCDLFSTPQMRKVFSDESLIQKWLDVEAALARAQKQLGIIPAEAADEICAKARLELIDQEFMIEQMRLTAHPIVPLLRCLKNICLNNAGEYSHWGATTQDIMDTATVLQIKEAHAIILGRARQVYRNCLELADKNRNLVAAGRTHGQHALPITIGFRFANWAAELERDIERLEACRKRLLVGQFSGAVGSLASLGADGLKVQELMMQELDLGIPKIAWFSSRDNIAEFISLLGILTATLGRICNQVILMQKTELSECEEPFAMGKVGSSTMPHKRNPTYSENVVALTRLVRANVGAAIEAMTGEDERDSRTWQMEWDLIGRTCCMTDAALKMSCDITGGLIVYPDNIEANLYKLNGLMLSENVMMHLGVALGRQEAHEIIYRACMEAFTARRPLLDVLWENETIRSRFTYQALADMLDPRQYIGICEMFIDRVLGK